MAEWCTPVSMTPRRTKLEDCSEFLGNRIRSYLKSQINEAGKMAHWLETIAALVEDLSLLPSAHIAAHSRP